MRTVNRISDPCEMTTRPEYGTGRAGRLLVGLAAALLLSAGSALAGEAPQLAEMVAADSLPALEERLPQNPVVVEPIEQVGTYGGTWRTAVIGAADRAYLSRTIGYENLVRWNVDKSAVIPNIVESFESNDEGNVFTFHLREGLRWSDGHPFTADDILFWYEDVMLNESLTPAAPSWMIAGGKPGVVRKIDDYTVEFAFSQPYGLFLQWLASWRGDAPAVYAKHYFSQFHPTYNPDGIDALVAEAGVADWVALFQSKGGTQADNIAHWQSTEAPRMYAWTMTQAMGDGTRAIAERNPYYFKVDPEGNQLPYLDRVTFDIVENTEVLLAKVIGGEVDFLDRHIFNPTNRSVIAEFRETGDYRFIDGIPEDMNTAVVSLNFNSTDPVKREIFQNLDFRVGLSHAVNRQEIIDLVFIGQGEPWQGAPQRETPFYNEKLAKQFTEFDLDLANEHLDRAFPDKDANGHRLGPDGNPISFQIEITAELNAYIVDVAEVLKTQWAKVGIDVEIRTMDRSLSLIRARTGQHDATIISGNGGLSAFMDPRFYLPVDGFSHWAPGWAAWLAPGGTAAVAEGNAEKVEPPEYVKEQMALYREIESTGDSARQNELMAQILDIAADHFYAIGISSVPREYAIAKNGLRNIVSPMIRGGAYYMNPAPTNPSQYYWQK